MVTKHLKAFKVFMKHMGIEKVMEGLYRSHRFTSNPQTFDEYLRVIEPDFAIVMAFDWNVLVSKEAMFFTRAYWYALHVKWLKELHKDAALMNRSEQAATVKEKELAVEMPLDEATAEVESEFPGGGGQPRMAAFAAGMQPRVAAGASAELVDFVPEMAGVPKGRKRPGQVRLHHKELLFVEKPATLVFNEELSAALRHGGCDSCEFKRNTENGHVVMVMGKRLQFRLRSYTTYKLVITSEFVSQVFTEYLGIQPGSEKIILTTLPPRWNADKSCCAVEVLPEHRKAVLVGG